MLIRRSERRAWCGGVGETGATQLAHARRLSGSKPSTSPQPCILPPQHNRGICFTSRPRIAPTGNHCHLHNMYSPVDSRNGHIRLLDLYPGHFDDSLVVHLHAAPLRDQHIPAYEALSYVWGTGSSTTRVHLKDDNKLQLRITANLGSALRHLRLPDQHRTLWIDAHVSIKQTL